MYKNQQAKAPSGLGLDSLTASVQTPMPSTAASEIVDFAERLANQAQALDERSQHRLRLVLGVECPQTANEPDRLKRGYPPLFSDLRERLIFIEAALNSIEYTLSRVEL